jgi:hypothetical protein
MGETDIATGEHCNGFEKEMYQLFFSNLLPAFFQPILLIVGHLIECGCNRQDQGSILCGLNLHSIGISNPEPFF